MQVHQVEKQLRFADAIVRFAWIGAGVYIACDVATYIYTAKMLSGMNNRGLTARLLENVKNTAIQFAFWPVASALVQTIIIAFIAVAIAHILRTLIWIAVRNGAVPGQSVPEDVHR